MNKPIYIGDCQSYTALVGDFSPNYDGVPPEGFPTEDELVLVFNNEDTYSGSIRFFWVRDGKPYEWSGSHCSCNSYREEVSSFAHIKPITPEYLMKQVKAPWLKESVIHEPFPMTDENVAAWNRLLDACR